jgi:hypothetical protein
LYFYTSLLLLARALTRTHLTLKHLKTKWPSIKHRVRKISSRTRRRKSRSKRTRCDQFFAFKFYIFFFSSSHHPKDLSLSFGLLFVLPNDDLISLTTVTALSGESESGKGGGEESEERRQAGRPQRIRIAKSNQQIIIFCSSFPIQTEVASLMTSLCLERKKCVGSFIFKSE